MKVRLRHVLQLSTGPIRVANSLTLSDETKKPSKTLVTTKVPLRHLNR